MKAPIYKKLLLIFVISFLVVSIYSANLAKIPISGLSYRMAPIVLDYHFDKKPSDKESSEKISISEFVNDVFNGDEKTICGVYITNHLALRVIQQPANNFGFVSSVGGEATQFSLAERYGVIGLLAHNYASGSYFFGSKPGEIVQIVYGDGNIDLYKITEIHEYQALNPNSSSSSFIDLYTGEKLSAMQLFKQMYMGSHHVVLQTCIQKGHINSWGRLFVIAEPL